MPRGNPPPPAMDPLGIPWPWDEIGTAMTLRRQQLGLSQTVVARILNWPARSTLADRECGYRPVPIKLFAKWCAAMKVIADMEIIDGVITVTLTERRKGYGLERSTQSPRRRPQDEAEDHPEAAS